MMYPASWLFKEPSAAYVFLAVFNIFVGVCCLFVTFVLDMFTDDKVGITYYFIESRNALLVYIIMITLRTGKRAKQ